MLPMEDDLKTLNLSLHLFMKTLGIGQKKICDRSCYSDTLNICHKSCIEV